MNTRLIEKYLKNYSESEAQIGVSLGHYGHWSHIVSVPACAESLVIDQMMESLSQASREASLSPLLILTINNRIDASREIADDNRKTWTQLEQALRDRREVSGPREAFLGRYGELAVLAVNRFSDGHELPLKQGVGLARKIGSDLALGAIFEGAVDCPYIFNTDADAIVGIDYFDLSEVEGLAQPGTFLTPFIHQSPEGASEFERTAIQLYDRYLHYYVDGLRRAGSAYSYHTVGSTIGYHADAYAGVRGFPRREAGEDFYLLNKLAKFGPVSERHCQPTLLQGRVSYRVPFGTGASVGRISKMLAEGEEYRVYDERCFDLLSIWLQGADRYLETGDGALLVAHVRSNTAALGVPEAGDLILSYVSDSGALNALDKARQSSRSMAQTKRHFTHWFDAFRTLKYIHAMRDSLLPSKPFPN